MKEMIMKIQRTARAILDPRAGSVSKNITPISAVEESPREGGKRHAARRALERGLTLIEIVTVLVILSILFAFLTKGLFNKGQQTKAQINLMKMNRLKDAINNYQLMYNALPSDINGLVSCNEQTGQACIPVAQEEDLMDVFGTKMTYSVEGSGRSYTLRSLGADRREGGSGADSDVSVQGP